LAVGFLDLLLGVAELGGEAFAVLGGGVGVGAGVVGGDFGAAGGGALGEAGFYGVALFAEGFAGGAGTVPRNNLPSVKNSPQVPPHELAGEHCPLAGTPGAGEAAAPLGKHSGAGGAEHGVRGRTGGRGSAALEPRSPHTTRFIETSRGILSYAVLAPLLAEQARGLESDISGGIFEGHPLDEALLLEIHRRLISGLLPNWAGKWWLVDVTVGNHEPPPFYRVPVLMRDYCRDLQARWPAATSGEADYFAALEAADANDLLPLVQVWQQRLER
jgi:hypothetical protein